MPPGMKVNTASGLSEAILDELRLEIQRAERHVGFLDDLPLVVELESGGRIPAGLIVRNQQIDALVAAILRDLAEDLVHLIVLVGGHDRRTGCTPCRHSWTGRRSG